jgi:hypothetical protein
MVIEKNCENLRKQNMGKGNNEDHKAAPAADKHKSKARNKIFGDIEKAGEINPSDLDFPTVASKKSKLEPIGSKPASKVATKANPAVVESDDFDLLGFDDNMEDVHPTSAEPPKNSDKGDDNFDFDFEDIDPKEGSKVPPEGNKITTGATDLDDLFGDHTNKAKPVKEVAKEAEKPIKTDIKTEAIKSGDKKEDGSKDDGEEYIVIDGKRFREIQIEGEEEEFLMDDDGNIYDKEGVYIGTAKDGAEEEEEEAEK